METRAHFVLIGAFTLAVLAGVFMLVLFFSGLGNVSPRNTYEIVFSGSVSGLSRGGSVLFNGLRVGEVVSIYLLPHDPSRVAAIVQVESGVPIKTDTKARLELQGLTGAAAVALIGGAPDAPDLKGKNGEFGIIYGEPSQIQNLLENVQNLSEKADSVLAKADKLISDNSDAITDTFRNVDAFSKALGGDSSGFKNALASLGDIGKKIGPLSDRLQKLSDDTDKLVVAVDPEKIKNVVNNVSDFSDSLSGGKESVKSILTDSASLAKRLNDTSVRLDSAITKIDELAKAIDTQKVATLMDGADALGDTLKQNRGNIDRMLKDAAELAAKLNNSADKVDGLMTSLQGFVGSPDVKGPIAEVGDAARSIRQLADDLNQRTKDISAGLVRFSNSGLREYEALAVDGRRTVNDLDRVLREFEKNPNQLIFGAKPALPEYHGGP